MTQSISAVDKLQKGLKILFVERRMPGQILMRWYSLLERFGVRFVDLKTRDGLSVRCMTNARVVFIEVFEKEEYAFPDFNFKDKVVIDIGANQGFFTVYAASRGARVFAIEPVAENAELLRENVRRNGLEDRVTLFEAAVTGTDTEVSLFVGSNVHGNARSETASIIDGDRGGVSVDVRQVEGIPIADLFARCGVDKIDFLKMDCEGAEFAIFDAMPRETLTAIGRAAVEYHNGRSAEIVAHLNAANFDVFQIDTDETGLIKAVNG